MTAGRQPRSPLENRERVHFKEGFDPHRAQELSHSDTFPALSSGQGDPQPVGDAREVCRDPRDHTLLPAPTAQAAEPPSAAPTVLCTGRLNCKLVHVRL